MGRREDIEEKVRARIEIKQVSPHVGTPCWLWTGPTSGDKGRGCGYPRMNLDDHTVAVHRVMWVGRNGFLSPKRQLDHVCEVRNCVNPDHLEAVTHRENQRRKKKRKKRNGDDLI